MIMDQNLATKSDLATMRSELTSVKSDLMMEMQKFEISLRSEIKDLEYKLVTRLGTLMTALIGIAVAIIKIQ